MIGQFMHQHIARVELEEGKPFFDVLKELAESGESKSSAAVLLDIPQTTLCRWLRIGQNVAFLDITWPAKNASNGFYANVKNRTPARLVASNQNLKKAQEARQAY